MSKFAVAILCAGCLCACATESNSLPASLDPSNPQAAEGRPLNVGPPPERMTVEEPREEDAGMPPMAGMNATEPRKGDAGMASMGQMKMAGPMDAGMPPMNSRDRTSANAKPDAGATVIYACPMHPQVRSDKPGHCPICGMKLVPTGGGR